MQENKDLSTEFTGTWHIYEMEEWDEDYLDEEVQAYIKIEPDNDGYFQFGLVCGEIDGRIVDYAEGERFEFTWEEKYALEGELRFHRGDSSTFLARRVE